jgi:transposase InsO family protein
VNRFPEYTRYIVQRLKTLCPMLGKVKIAQILARAGLHLGATTVGRIRNEKPCHEPSTSNDETAGKEIIVTAKYPNHVWRTDLAIVPTGLGFCCSWMPFALPQKWPFCYWVAIAIDHFSRRVMGATAFKDQPNCREVCSFLGRTIAKAGKAPRHIICDRGKQFDCKAFRKWCKKRASSLRVTDGSENMAQ